MSVVTRFAPSPTGYLHIGGARTALYSWLHARQNGGRFVLRIEDTDRERSTPEAVQAILDGMEWLGLDADEAPVYQTDRFDRYKAVIQQLLDEGKAYHCYSTAEEVEAMREAARAKGEKPRYDGSWRPSPGKTLPEPPADVPPVVRFANPLEGDTVIHDLIKGDITISNTELDDLIIARSDGTPTYNFCVVVDDMDMGITHIIRGDDHVNNTPRQINIFRALVGEESQLPHYAHVPMILGADGKRLSKRHGAVGVMTFREQGILPEALINYLVRLGWSQGDKEIFSREEMVESFRLESVQKGAATFDPDKLLWVNQEHIKAMPAERLGGLLAAYLAERGVSMDGDVDVAAVADILRERGAKMVEMADKAEMFFVAPDEYDAKAVKKFCRPANLELLAQVRDRLAALPDWSPQAIHEAVHGVAEANDAGLGKVAQPIRVAVAGVPVSPPIDTTLAVLGRDATLARIDRALEKLDRSADN